MGTTLDAAFCGVLAVCGAPAFWGRDAGDESCEGWAGLLEVPRIAGDDLPRFKSFASFLASFSSAFARFFSSAFAYHELCGLSRADTYAFVRVSQRAHACVLHARACVKRGAHACVRARTRARLPACLRAHVGACVYACLHPCISAETVSVATQRGRGSGTTHRILLREWPEAHENTPRYTTAVAI